MSRSPQGHTAPKASRMIRRVSGRTYRPGHGDQFHGPPSDRGICRRHRAVWPDRLPRWEGAVQLRSAWSLDVKRDRRSRKKEKELDQRLKDRIGGQQDSPGDLFLSVAD